MCYYIVTLTRIVREFDYGCGIMNEREELLQLLLEHPEFISLIFSVLQGREARELPDQ